MRLTTSVILVHRLLPSNNWNRDLRILTSVGCDLTSVEAVGNSRRNTNSRKISQIFSMIRHCKIQISIQLKAIKVLTNSNSREGSNQNLVNFLHVFANPRDWAVAVTSTSNLDRTTQKMMRFITSTTENQTTTAPPTVHRSWPQTNTLRTFTICSPSFGRRFLASSTFSLRS